MSDPTGAHNRAISALDDARQNTRKHLFLMEKSDQVVVDAIFIDPANPNHPQKSAHAALLDYHDEVNQPEYTIKMDDIWTENLSDARGRDIKIQVPKVDTVAKTVTDDDGIENILPDRENIPDSDLREEKLTLETLGAKWRQRQVTVEVEVDSPYYSGEPRREQIRLWLPPIAIKAAYSQLNSALSKIGLLAQTTAPVETDPEPI